MIWKNSAHLGEYIRAKREELEISQQAVAFALGMSQPAYSKIERGETEVKASQLYKIAAYLSLSIYDLLPEASQAM
ncbi:Helix-turn-helix [Parapedobacter composti]|uniref:Helix-turn-helix n=1 Tax=Parapedobacter composti TaxID=623281 RepID=A0A1I1F4I6_9SPHI|nr:helix-turn-helix transcriptional regulator [Parapedobacter composti]SFB93852.1 Helix-turn-helix [Parapedobacter composti]